MHSLGDKKMDIKKLTDAELTATIDKEGKKLLDMLASDTDEKLLTRQRMKYIQLRSELRYREKRKRRIK